MQHIWDACILKKTLDLSIYLFIYTFIFISTIHSIWCECINQNTMHAGKCAYKENMLLNDLIPWVGIFNQRIILNNNRSQENMFWNKCDE